MTRDAHGAALAYAARGFYVFPCHVVRDGVCSCGRACGRDAGKHPRTRHGLLDATIDAAVIGEWFGCWPGSNVGISCGPSGLVVIDLDGADYDLPATLTATTGRGSHLYYAAPPGVRIRNSADELAPGVDVRADGGYVLAPPSLHRSGRRYQWVTTVRPAPLPIELAARLAKPPPPTPGPHRELAAGHDGTSYGLAALERIAAELAQAPNGRRNDTANRLAFRCGKLAGAGELNPHAAYERLAAITDAWPDQAKTRSTLRRGIAEGQQYPAQRWPR